MSYPIHASELKIGERYKMRSDMGGEVWGTLTGWDSKRRQILQDVIAISWPMIPEVHQETPFIWEHPNANLMTVGVQNPEWERFWQ